MFQRRSKRGQSKTRLTRDNVSLGANTQYTSATSREIRVTEAGQTYSHSISPSKKHTRWAQLEKWAGPEDREDLALDPSSEWLDVALDGEVYDEHEFHRQPVPRVKAKARLRTLRALRPQEHWRKHCQQSYLEELCRSDGRGDAKGQVDCWDCQSRPTPFASPHGAAQYRCLDCFGEHLLCGPCCARRHKYNPLHNVERWNGQEFLETSLKSLGVVLQLNHISNHCKNPVECHRHLQILHTNGIHEVKLMFCNCEHQVAQHLQLLRRGMYPASEVKGRIRTVATFRLLEQLHIYTLTAKTSIYDLYRALAKLTDNTGVKKTPWRYKALSRMILQWRHLKSLKRAGRAHDPSGVAGTVEGELTIPCPSCPHPGINLPDGWESSKKPFLYALMVAMDANFRLKEQIVSSHSRNPGLTDGLGYFVRRVPYEEYVFSRASDEDISTCVGFMAIAMALTKFSKGLRYTGVGALCCARGEMVLPNGVGNLQLGERYANMDYVFSSALRHYLGALMVIVGYDIACQWFVNMTSRMTSHWPVELRIDPKTKVVPVIGKFHEPAHLQKDHERYSANLLKWVGLTDFEVLERLWAIHNALGNATKTMAPGTRGDTLESNFGFHNWLKYIAHGATLWSKYKNAIRDRNLQREAHRGFTANLPEELTERWETVCEAWEADPDPKSGNENPFEVNEEFLSEAEVEREIAADEVQRARSETPMRHKTSAGKFLMRALELEDEQFKLKDAVKEFKDSTQTTRQSKTLLEKRSALQESLRGYEQLRAVYMPGLLQYVTSQDMATFQSDDVDAEEANLWLPSSISKAEDRRMVCIDNVAAIEERLRLARCYDALNRLRHTLRVKARMVLFKNSNVRGQRESGRSRQVIDDIHNRAKGFAEKYRRNRAALHTLSGGGEWENVLRELKNSDVTSYADPARVKKGPGRRGTNEEEPGKEGIPVEEDSEPEAELNLLAEERSRRDGTGETRKTLSWIWTTFTIDVADGADTHDDLLRGEWARSRARANRTQEEVELVREEMRRTDVFLGYQAQRWKKRSAARTDLDERRDHRLVEGLAAYASKQVRIQTQLQAKFVALWKQPLEGKLAEDEQERAERAQFGIERGVDDEDSDEDDDDDEEEGDDQGDLDMPDREEEAEEAEEIGWA